ncbi:MAG: segregation and condensation protein A [Bacillota bacterium]
MSEPGRLGDLVDKIRGRLDELEAQRRRDRNAYREQIVELEIYPWVREAEEILSSNDDSLLDGEAELLRLLSELTDKKSAALVSDESPADSFDIEEEERSEELFRHLVEFSRYREVAQELDRRAEQMRRTHPRIPPEVIEWERALADIEGADLEDLVGALEQLLAREVEPEGETISREQITISACMRRIRGILEISKGRVNFADLFPRGGGRSLYVGTFIALLEMIRSGEVTVAQRDRFGDIQVYATEPEGETDVEE